MAQILNESTQPVSEQVRSTLADFLSAVQQSGGVYHLDSDITLTSNVTMASNTMIIFEGGKIIGNYTLTGNRSTIVSPPRQIFSGVTLAGTWNVDCCYAEWWGAVGNGSTNDATAIQKALSSPIERVILLNKTYLIKTTLSISSRKVLEGTRQSNDHEGKPQLLASPTNTTMNTIVSIASDFVTIRNIYVKNGTENVMNYGFSTSEQHYRLVLEGLASTGCSIGFYLNTFLSKVERCTATGVFTGFSIKGGTSVTMTNCFVKSYKQNAYYLETLTYSTLMNCCADTWKPDSSVSDGGSNWYIYYIKWCNSLSLINCAGEEAAKGIYFDGGANMTVRNCWFNMPFMTTSVNDKRILFFLNCDKVEIDGLYISNWVCMGWTTNNGWFNESNLIKINCSSGTKNTVRLHNVYYRGYDRDKTIIGYEEVKQILSDQLITAYNATGCFTDILVEYDWIKRGTTANRPSGLGNYVGAGFVYFNTSTGNAEIWNGSAWQTL